MALQAGTSPVRRAARGITVLAAAAALTAGCSFGSPSSPTTNGTANGTAPDQRQTPPAPSEEPPTEEEIVALEEEFRTATEDSKVVELLMGQMASREARASMAQTLQGLTLDPAAVIVRPGEARVNATLDGKPHTLHLMNHTGDGWQPYNLLPDRG